jgi:DNA-binding MarR family transcriptional regulator
MASDSIKSREDVQMYIIECLNRFYAIESGLWGDPVDCLMIRTIFKGKVEGRYYDISSLSSCLGLSIATVHRKVKSIESRGYIELCKEGRSVRLKPTPKLETCINDKFDDMMATLQQLYKGGDVD